MTSTTLEHTVNASNAPINRAESPGVELRCCQLSWLLVAMYRAGCRIGSHRLTQAVLRIALKIEGGEFYSLTARKIMLEQHGIDIGAYSYGCFDSIRFPGGVRVGRFVSIARSVRSYRRNHPLRSLSTHPLLFEEDCETRGRPETSTSELVIDHDAWVGAHAVILPSCTRIGVGAVIGAGSVVTKDIEPYAIVAGNPAKVIGHRFDPDTIRRLRKSRWWENPTHFLRNNIGDLENEVIPLETGD